MKPTFTCHFVRHILRTLGSGIKTNPDGTYVSKPPFPEMMDIEPMAFRQQWLAYNVARKLNPGTADLRPLKKAAIDGFLRCEEQNARLNKTGLASLARDDAYTLIRAREIVLDILGEAPNLKEIFRNAAFTGGASTSRKRREAHPALKWWARPSLQVTPLCLTYLKRFKESIETLNTAWDLPGVLSVDALATEHVPFEVVPGSRFDTVRKNSETDRTILIEPDGNMLLQRGVGITMRERLHRVGINLHSQETNQRLAYIASKYNTLATVDVRDASNTIASFTVGFLLPEKWYDFLYHLRSHLCLMPDGTWHRLEMFSSMGNGFTFELETIIFYALAKACVEVTKSEEKRVVVYGDDIIVASSAYDHLVRVFTLLGFTINSDKSFVDGPFRESCGKHYFRGVDVTPFYLLRDLDTGEKLRIINSFHYWVTGDFSVPLQGAEFSTLNMLISSLRAEDRNQVPLEYSNNSGLYSPLYSRPIKVRINKKGHVLMYFRYYRNCTVDITNRIDPEVWWLFTHMTGYTSSSLDIVRRTAGKFDIVVPERVPMRLRIETGGQEWKTAARPFYEWGVIR